MTVGELGADVAHVGALVRAGVLFEQRDLLFDVLAGIAKPMPWAPACGFAVDWLTPIRRPSMSTSGPPELPGLIGAEVWSRPLNSCEPPFSPPIGLVAVEARDDADRRRLLQFEGFADRDRPLAGLEPIGVREFDRRGQLGIAVDLDQRKSAPMLAEKTWAGTLSPLGKTHFDFETLLPWAEGPRGRW